MGVSLLTNLERFVDVDGGEIDGAMGSTLGERIALGTHDGSHGHVAATRNGVSHQNNRLTGHLDGADGIAEVDDVGDVRSGTEGLLAFFEHIGDIRPSNR